MSIRIFSNKVIVLVFLAIATNTTAIGQTSKPQLPTRENYEWQGELPVYVEQLKQELTYPMAWGNSPIKNFAKWKNKKNAIC